CVGFAGEAEFGGAADVVDGRETVLRAELAESQRVAGRQIARFDEGGWESGGGDAGRVEGSAIRDEEPLCKRGECGVGEGLQGDLGADASGVSDSDGDAWFAGHAVPASVLRISFRVVAEQK